MVEFTRRSGKATASLVLGIGSLVASVVAGVPAILLGTSAIREIRQSGGALTGARCAMAGIALGSLTTSLLIPAIAIAFLLPAAHSFREGGRRARCSNNLKHLGLALGQYESKFGSMPPAMTVDAAGQPMQSWRGLILEHLDRPLATRLRLDEPWNSPANTQVGKELVGAFRCLSAPLSQGVNTNYVAVVGPGFLFDGTKSKKLSDITDGPSNTIMLVEVADSGIPWTAPRDITYAELVERLQDRTMSFHTDGFQVLFCDGGVKFLYYGMASPTFMHRLLTIAGGERTIDE